MDAVVCVDAVGIICVRCMYTAPPRNAKSESTNIDHPIDPLTLPADVTPKNINIRINGFNFIKCLHEVIIPNLRAVGHSTLKSLKLEEL